MKNLVGKPFREIIGKGYWGLFRDVTSPDKLCPFVRMHESRRRETTLVELNNRWLDILVDPILDETGALIGGVQIVSDVTERKRAEEKLKEYSEKLEQMVEERTRELRDVHEQLIRHEKLVVLGQLAGGVSHELRNPLGAIKNASYFLNMALEQNDPEIRETLGILEKEVATSERIINSMLDFARPRPPILQKVALNGLLLDIITQCTIPINIEVVTRFDENLPVIMGDSVQLERVFSNIIQNAIQAMPDGGKLKVESNISEHDIISISITDNGVGISDENVRKLFEPLFTTKAKGIGLGLAIVKNLVERHGGVIEVNSVVGKGSTFTVKLPIKQEMGDENG
jgi:signal transduction histidine kinase